ncbi:1,4-dihydroxy-6-naphthoate synthase [bacterium]|nr:1,4-dihydroxy-6-naphthoate synthase [bacterium]
MTLGYSFCPNDTFIFHAITHGLVPGVQAQECLADVETLNVWAGEARLELTKVSYHAYFHVMDKYVALRSGGALGRGVGPLLVAPPGRELRRVATPGAWTTAQLLLQLARPDLSVLECLRYDQIIPAIHSGQVDGGVLIHESRFTYAQHGLEARLDLGQWWEEQSGLPLPLGVILARRDLGLARVKQLEAAVRLSLQMAWQQPAASRAYIRQHALELSDEIVEHHIRTYVNEFSADVGEEGVRAVEELALRAQAAGLVAPAAHPYFLA